MQRGDKILPADLMQGIKAPPADGSFVPVQSSGTSQAMSLAASRPVPQQQMRPPGQARLSCPALAFPKRYHPTEPLNSSQRLGTCAPCHYARTLMPLQWMTVLGLMPHVNTPLCVQVASRVASQPVAAQGALQGQARPQMAMQYIPQQQAPMLEVSHSSTCMIHMQAATCLSTLCDAALTEAC